MEDAVLRKRTVVLIVEDEPLILMNAVDIVVDADFEAVEATNADEAIRILATRDDMRVVFTDMDMPGSMDGLKLACSCGVGGRRFNSLSHPAISK